MGTESVKILLVEDQPADAGLVREMLAVDDAGRFDISHVTSMEAALALLARERFDALLLDLSLPDAQGLTAVTQLQREAPWLPIVVLSTVLFLLGSETRLGPAMFTAYNASKDAQKAIALSVAYEFGHLGIHSVALDVDGAVDSARVRESMPNVDPSHFVSPDQIADEIVRLINQPRTGWSYAVDLRSYAQWRPRVAPKKKE